MVVTSNQSVPEMAIDLLIGLLEGVVTTWLLMIDDFYDPYCIGGFPINQRVFHDGIGARIGVFLP